MQLHVIRRNRQLPEMENKTGIAPEPAQSKAGSQQLPLCITATSSIGTTEDSVGQFSTGKLHFVYPSP